MKKLLFACSVLALFSCQIQAQNTAKTASTEKLAAMNTESIYQFKVKDIEGKTFDFSKLKGKKIMVVNTASECGLTPQYEQLQKLYTQYKDKNLIIVGFPANNFGAQEPGSNKEIATFCSKNYGVTFPMMEKISVKGEDMHPLYHFLTEKSKNGLQDSQVEWNFQKYLINEKGNLVKVISPKTLPDSKEVIDWITKG
ncbi:glutathione peroxidase [Flavobacterium cerinum]|uniref:Glutathione peroxidase n=1 Tax=Flavobacterium cerinum TaxID=2502784 RepID=A0ABY5IPF6_9FLAO|nr:glutathione peroxidase [Flavobacterium cerinum]UUC44680.1 glutathione peroxidase [Flavobacterium cerinum]